MYVNPEKIVPARVWFGHEVDPQDKCGRILLCRIIIPEFPTHVQMSKKSRKTGYPVYKKLNGQYWYNGKWHYHEKAKITTAIHKHLIQSITKNENNVKLQRLNKKHLPVESELIIATLKTHGGIGIRAGSYIFKNKNASNWDIGNLGMFWTKMIEDVLCKLQIIPDDSIDYLVRNAVNFHQVDNFKNRKIVINLYKHGT